MQTLVLLATLLPGPADGSDLLTSHQRHELRANEFTSSRQDEVALARDPRGGVVLVWQSRRQEEGSYGVYARRFDDAGQPVTGEVRINATTASMQMSPAVTVDDQGGVWFAWRSFGQGAGGWAAVARRFDAGLEHATAEVLLDPAHTGEQADVLLASASDGGVTAFWTTPEGELDRLMGRRISGDGSLQGEPFRVDDQAELGVRTPALATLEEGGMALVWGAHGPDGVPVGNYLRRLDGEGRAHGASLRFDGGQSAIEPVVAAAADGTLGLAWFEPLGDGHLPLFRTLRFEAQGIELGERHELDVPETGWSTGLELCSGPEGWLLTSSHHGDGVRHHAGLFARKLDQDGAPKGDAVRITDAVDGHQKLTPARGTQRAFWDTSGLMGFAWFGDGGLGDDSGAHLTLLRSEDHVVRGTELAGPRLAQVDTEVSDEQGAQPHDPPVFDPRQVERRPDEPPVQTFGSDIDFLGVSNTGWTPPDPHMAVGPEDIVVMTNGAIAGLSKTGTLLFQDEIEGPGGFWGAQGATGFVFDPEALYDPHSGRYMVQAAERDGSTPYFVFAISADSTAPGAWHKYRLNVQSAAGDTDIDSNNLAVDENAIYLTADFFGPDKFLVYVIDKASVLNGGTPVVTSTVVTGQQSMGVPVTYDAGAPAQYMIHAREFTTSSVLDLWAVTDPLNTVSTQSTTITVPSYSHPGDPPQMGTSSRPELFEARFWSAVYRDGYLWATHHQGTPAIQRWYQIAMNGWPTSGQQPSLVQSGDVDPGGGAYSFFGSIWVDDSENMGLTFARSSSNEFISMQRTYRVNGDAPGTTRPQVQVIGSTSPENSGRWGDYSSTSDDPAEPGRFWGHHEYRTGSWSTRVAGWLIDPCVPGVSSFCQTSPNSVGPGADLTNSGSTSIGADDFVLQCLGLPTNQSGIFYYGPNEVNMAFGNGIRCVGGTTHRLPIVTSDLFGFAFHPLDYASPPSAAGQIQAGSTWKFQYWYRDPAAGGAAFNLSDGLSATFCP